MTIRIGLPAMAAPPLNVGWRAAGQVVSGHIKSLQLTAERLVKTPVAWGLKVVAGFRRRFSLRSRVLRRQRALLKAFDDRYEQLVDLLCWAAQSSGAVSRDNRYREIRSWMRSHYGAIRIHLHPHWAETLGAGARDPFESLTSFDRVDDVLYSHSSIEDMMLCRKALDAHRYTLDRRRAAIA